MIFFLNCLIIFFMLCGIICTLSPKMLGTAIILGTLLVYGFVTDFKSMSARDLMLLSAISFTIEVTNIILRSYLSKQYQISMEYAVDSSMGKCAGIIALNTVFGSNIGIFLGMLITSRANMPDIHLIIKILLSLSVIALGRVAVGTFMVVFAIYYVLE